MTERLANAPTEGLRAKYQAALGELVEAYELLNASGKSRAPTGSGLSRTQMQDLPGAAPSYTQHGSSSSAAEELPAGTVVADRYSVRHLLGRGGMGAVYEALDRLKSERVAIKVLLPSLLGSEKAKERFLNEAKIACRLAHPHIVKVFDVGVSGGHYFMTMSCSKAQTLRQRMEAQELSRTEFEIATITDYAEQLIDALSYAHRSIVHRDLKPENVWLEEDGQLKLMDFGIARAFTNTELTKTGMAMGTASCLLPAHSPVLVQRTAPQSDRNYPLTQPDYPPPSRRNGETGRVILMVCVSAEGSVVDAALLQSSGFPRLDEAALSEVRRSWRLRAGTIDGRPTAMWGQFAVSFTLSD